MEVTLRVKICEGTNLAACNKDKLSDPYVRLRVGSKRYKTQVINNTLNPKWNVSFDIPLNSNKCTNLIYLSVWDEDTFRGFMGEVSIPLHCAFSRNSGTGLNDGQPRYYDDPLNFPVCYQLGKRSAKDNVSGEIVVKIGFISHTGCDPEQLKAVWDRFVQVVKK